MPRRLWMEFPSGTDQSVGPAGSSQVRAEKVLAGNSWFGRAFPIMLSGSAVVLGLWIKLPWLGIAGLCVLTAEMMYVIRRGVVTKSNFLALWVCTLLLPASSLLGTRDFIGTGFWTAIAWLNAAVIVMTGKFAAEEARRPQWQALGFTWAMFGSASLLWAAYVNNIAVLFYVGLAANVGLLIVCKTWFRFSGRSIQVVNTGVLFLIALPIVDWIVRPRFELDPNPDPRKKYFLYENARQNPGGYVSWCRYAARGWAKAERVFYLIEPAATPRHRLKPNSRGLLYHSQAYINSHGFRGPEMAEPKGNTYRIVALGESTTFGITLNEEDKPWPEILEALIRKRLNAPRPVEVINAGMPGYDLNQNLERWRTEILPLRPDMIISYHGVNGFHLFDKAFPRTSFANPPAYAERPVKLLADCEYRVKLFLFKMRYFRVGATPPAIGNPRETDYAKAYEKLIEISKSNSVRLVLADFSMAVNEGSDPQIGEFYRQAWPTVFWCVRANILHSRMVRELAAEHPEVIFVHTAMDGQHQKFIDLVHFTHEGDEEMAETIFNGIRKTLEGELFGARTQGASDSKATK